jgi:hypothetical protein
MHAVASDPDRDDAQPASAGSGRQVIDVAADSQRTPPISPGELVAGRYSVDRILASGGMGVVWLGHHVELEQPVAIKFLRRSFSENAALVARFLDEARAAAALRSEHIVRVMDVGQLPSGVPYFVMEYLEGIELETLVKREGPLGVEQTVDYVLQVCDGLAEAHRAGIVHRDVKPENLFLIQRPGQRPIVKIVDFGIAKRLDATRAKVVTGPQDNMGSPCYMSPEQMASPHAIDARTDIWSLGVVLYQLLTGELPFDGDTLVEVFARVAQADVRPISERRPDVDAHLEAIVRRCLEKDPDLRYSSSEALAEALRGYRAAALSRTSPVLEVVPLSLRSDAPVALAKEDHPARGVGFAAAFIAVAALGAGAAVLVQTDAAVIHRLVGLARPPAILATDDGESTRELAARRTFGAYVVEPFGALSDGDYVRAEPELDLDEDEADAKVIDEPLTSGSKFKAPPQGVSREPSAVLSDGETDPSAALARQRAYRAYLDKHHWRPLREVLEELKAPENVTGAASAAPPAEPTPPAAAEAPVAPSDAPAPPATPPNIPKSDAPAETMPPTDLKPP